MKKTKNECFTCSYWKKCCKPSDAHKAADYITWCPKEIHICDYLTGGV